MGKWYDYDFGQSRKEKYVGPGTGSITVTPDRKGYSKTGSGKRMKISEKNTWKREVDYGMWQANQSMLEAQAAMNAMNAERSKPSPKPADVSSQFSKETYDKNEGWRSDTNEHRQARRRVTGRARDMKRP